MIKDLFQLGNPLCSIEVFPPKKTSDIESIYQALDQFTSLNPAFISVTYGAGGSTSRSTVDIATYIKKNCNVEALAHLTCASLTNEESLRQFTEDLKKGGIENILALRGDQPKDIKKEQFDKRYYPYAADLVLAIREFYDFSIAGACYPEKHPESETLSKDIEYLKAKVECGTDFLITQLFYDNDIFYRYLERIRKAGIRVPVCAGLMPVTAISQVNNIIALSGTKLPKDLASSIERFKESPDDLKIAGLHYTKKQMEDLVSHGIDGIHLYSMNKVDIAQFIFRA